MKKFLSLIIAILTLFPAAKATWEGEYEFANGVNVIRRPTGFQLRDGGLSLNIGETLHLSKYSKIGRLQPKEDVLLSIEMNQKQFRNELLKLGNIKNYKTNPPEALPQVKPSSLPLPPLKNS